MFGDCSILKCLWDSATFFLVPTSNKYSSARWEYEDLEFCMLSYCNKQYNQTMFILTPVFFRHTCSSPRLMPSKFWNVHWVCGLSWFNSIPVLKGYLGKVKCHLFLDFPAIKYIFDTVQISAVFWDPLPQKKYVLAFHPFQLKAGDDLEFLPPGKIGGV